MIQITPHMKILLAVEPVDFRKGIDGLAGVCRNILKHDPFSGYVFIFKNKRGTALKILFYDGQGFWLCMKRFSKGKLCWWPNHVENNLCNLASYELQILLWNSNPKNISVSKWKEI